jgi:hypothetical protein
MIPWGDDGRPSFNVEGAAMRRLVLFLGFVWTVLAVASYLGGI